MKDLMGKEIKAGDYVAYAQRHSSSLWVNVAKVLKVTPKSVAIRAVEVGWDGKLHLLTRNSTISCPDRTVIVEPSEQYRQLLEPFIPQMGVPCFSEMSQSQLPEQSS